MRKFFSTEYRYRLKVITESTSKCYKIERSASVWAIIMSLGFDYGWKEVESSYSLASIEDKIAQLRQEMSHRVEYLPLPILDSDLSIKDAPKLVGHPLESVRVMVRRVLGG